MITITTTEPLGKPAHRRRAIAPLSVADVEHGALQEGQDLDFKRLVDLRDERAKSALVDDVVSFLNRGPGRIIVGVEEDGGRFGGFRPLAGNPDKAALQMQTVIQDQVVPVPMDVEVVPLHLNHGYILDVRIPAHSAGPYMNRMTGGYRIRSGARNLPIEPGMLRSRFVDELVWLRTLDGLTGEEDARLAEVGVNEPARALRVGILPREHFDHTRRPFSQADHVRWSAPAFHEGSRAMFEVCEDGHRALSRDGRGRGIESVFIRDDWFVHAHASFALGERRGEGRLGLHEFDRGVRDYLGSIAEFLQGQEVEGPFAVTLALQALGRTENFHDWFPNTTSVRTLRPLIVDSVDDGAMVGDFLRRVRQASRLS